MNNHNPRRFDGGSLAPVDKYDLRGELLPPEPKKDGRQLAPYTPPTIRINGKEEPRYPAGEQHAPSGWELTRQTAERTPDRITDVVVPGLQALLTAVAFGCGAGLISWAFGWSWRVPVAIMGLALIIGWLWRLRIVDGLLWRIETALRRDLTGDGHTGPPPAQPFTVVDPAQARATSHQVQQADAESEKRDELLAFLARCYTHGTSEASHHVKAGGPDRDRYLACRDTLLHLGVAAWKNAARPRAGWILTMSETDAEAVIMRHVLR
jgi:hypothetical protein